VTSHHTCYCHFKHFLRLILTSHRKTVFTIMLILIQQIIHTSSERIHFFFIHYWCLFLWAVLPLTIKYPKKRIANGYNVRHLHLTFPETLDGTYFPVFTLFFQVLLFFDFYTPILELYLRFTVYFICLILDGLGLAGFDLFSFLKVNSIWPALW